MALGLILFPYTWHWPLFSPQSGSGTPVFFTQQGPDSLPSLICSETAALTLSSLCLLVHPDLHRALYPVGRTLTYEHLDLQGHVLWCWRQWGLLGRIQTHAQCFSTEQEEKQGSSLSHSLRLQGWVLRTQGDPDKGRIYWESPSDPSLLLSAYQAWLLRLSGTNGVWLVKEVRPGDRPRLCPQELLSCPHQATECL